MKRPILVAVIGFIIGIKWGYIVKYNIAFFYLFVFILYWMFLKIRNKGKFHMFSLYRYLRYLKLILNKTTVIILVITSIISNIWTVILNQEYEHKYDEIDSDEKVIARVIDNGKEKEYKRVYKLKVESINGDKSFSKTKLFLYVKKEIVLEYGDRIEFIGEYQKPNEARNENGFDYKHYLKTIQVYGTIKTDKVKILEKDTNFFLLEKTNKLFLDIKERVQDIFPDDVSSVLLGILLGYTEEIDDETKLAFQYSSISHILAVSGMHISYIILGLTIILKDKVGNRRTKIIILVILILYMCLTNFTPSVVRASIMGIILISSSLIYRKQDTWTSIAISLAILLIYYPFFIDRIGLQLSYLGTIGIILFQKDIKRVFEIVREKKKKTKNNRNRLKRKSKFQDNIEEMIAVIVSAQLIILPILIQSFHLVSVSFIITNILVTVLVGPILILGLFQVLFSYIFFPLAEVFSYILIPLLKLLIKISEIGTVSYLQPMYITTPSAFTVFVYYFILVISHYIFYCYTTKKQTAFTKRIRNLTIILKIQIKRNRYKMLAILVSLICISIVLSKVPKDLRINFIDVGQGDCTLIQTPNNQRILIDGGGSESKDFDVGESTLLPYLLDKKINEIDYIVISHADQDHIRTGY